MSEPETIQEAKTEYARQRIIELISLKMEEMNAVNVSDEEIERCLKGCVAANKMTSLAKLYRPYLRIKHSEPGTQLTLI